MCMSNFTYNSNSRKLSSETTLLQMTRWGCQMTSCVSNLGAAHRENAQLSSTCTADLQIHKFLVVKPLSFGIFGIFGYVAI